MSSSGVKASAGRHGKEPPIYLTPEQWALVQPLLCPAGPPSPGRPSAGRPRLGRPRLGRPPPDLRPVLEAILWKISCRQPWHTLPDGYPKWQTCYRYYRLWDRSGLLDQIYRLLYQDLVERGGLDLPAALAESAAGGAGAVSFHRQAGRYVLEFHPVWHDTWQLETARLFLALAAARLPRPKRPRPLNLARLLAANRRLRTED